MKRIRSSRILLEEGLFDGFVYVDGGRIAAVTAEELPADGTYDVADCYVSPGFIDIHTHGGGGYSFEGDEGEIVEGCNFHFAHGTTAICPTVSAAPIDSMARSAERIRRAMSDPRLQGTILGAHLEGPYLSQGQTGAQCGDFVKEPQEEEYLPLLSRLGEGIARWSYAPERDRDGRFVSALRAHGVLPCAGHTDAIYEDMLRAVQGGCGLVTHLYSCTSTVTREHGFRRPGVIESAYLLDELAVEIICDGKHLPPELIRLVYKIKGAENIALVTDSLHLAGTEHRHGWMQSTEYMIEDGVCKLMDRTAFAGSIATADLLLRVAVTEAGIPLSDAVRMLTATPARIMGVDQRKGRLSAGMDADLVIFDERLEIKDVFSHERMIPCGL